VGEDAAFCPGCGAALRDPERSSAPTYAPPPSPQVIVHKYEQLPPPKKRGFSLGRALLVLVGILILAAVFGRNETGKNTSVSTAESKKEPAVVASSKIFREGETITVGYTSYVIWRSWWSNQLSNNQFLNHPPDAMYLFVELTVRNNDTKARTIPSFYLLDDNGSEYEASSRGWGIDQHLGILADLNPTVSKRGKIVFDVPKGRNYRIKLSGGFWSSDNAYVRLEPK
jgi:hypothetical protein